MLPRFAANLRRPAASSLALVRWVSSGSVKITEPLNFWAGQRRSSTQKSNGENVYEPATGKKTLFLRILMLLSLSLSLSLNVRLNCNCKFNSIAFSAYDLLYTLQ